ncbi:MAG: hypothetical protein ACTSXJ_06810 [Candidatus Baldrarchaeia archaeon]
MGGYSWRRIAAEMMYIVALSSLVSLPLAAIYYVAEPRIEAAPFSEEEMGILAASLNVVIFMIVAALGFFLMYFLIIRRRTRILIVTFAVLFFLPTFTGVYLTAMVLLSVLTRPILPTLFIDAVISVVSMAFALIITRVLLHDYPVGKKNAATITYCSLTGILLGVSLPLMTLLMLSLALAAYDFYNVRSGRLRKILEGFGKNGNKREFRNDPIENVSISFVGRNVELGLGDLILYNALVVRVLMSFDILHAVLAIIGIFVGIAITSKFLERHTVYPGLPIPIVIAMAFALVPLLIPTGLL